MNLKYSGMKADECTSNMKSRQYRNSNAYSRQTFAKQVNYVGRSFAGQIVMQYRRLSCIF